MKYIPSWFKISSPLIIVHRQQANHLIDLHMQPFHQILNDDHFQTESLGSIEMHGFFKAKVILSWAFESRENEKILNKEIIALPLYAMVA